MKRLVLAGPTHVCKIKFTSVTLVGYVGVCKGMMYEKQYESSWGLILSRETFFDVMQFISWYGSYIFPACGVNIFKLYYIGNDR